MNTSPSISPKGALYRHLNEEQSEIRLLELYPGKQEDLIWCDLHHHNLEHIPRYEALSYEWGCQKVKVPIAVGAQAGIDISSNLASALRRIRDPEKPRLLWVDQICINQNDIAERSSQVALMRDIYEKAKRVIVWLGHDNKTGEDAMRFVQEITLLAKVQPGKLHMFILKCKDEIMPVLFTIMFNTYFERYWITQEIVLARDVVVYCGSERAPWREVVDALIAIRQRHDLGAMVQGAMEQPRHISNALPFKTLDELHTVRQKMRRPGLRAATSWAQGVIRSFTFPRTAKSSMDAYQPQICNSPLSYWHLLRSFRYSNTSDASDRIYALLGLCETGNLMTLRKQPVPNFSVDYNREPHVTYRLFARYVIERDRNLSWLSHAGSPRQFSDLPSWAPDLELPPGQRPDDLSLRQQGLYAAVRGSKCRVRFSSDCSSLWCDGAYLDDLVHFIADPNIMFMIAWKGKFDELVTPSRSIEAAQQLYGNDLRSKLYGLSTAERLPNGARAPPGVAFLDLCRMLAGSDTSKISYQSMILLRDLTLKYRAVFVSHKGYVGLVPRYASIGDVICILFGCEFPVLLRPDGDAYRYIGDW